MNASTDPIADMLTRIRNAILVGSNEVEMPYSTVKERVVKVLVSSGFLAGVSTSGEKTAKKLKIVINEAGANPAITHLSRVSKPGRRIYVQAKEIKPVKRGRGLVVLSTSSGIMSGVDAKAKKLGGELICEVY